MLPRCVPIALSACLPLVGGCNTTMLEIRFEPADAHMSKVVVDDQPAAPAGQGVFKREIKFANDQSERNVTVVATSEADVVVTKTGVPVSKSEKTVPLTLKIPAQLKVVTRPQSDDVKLDITPKPRAEKDGLYDLDGGNITIVANNTKIGTDARQSVSIKAGERRTVELDTTLAAVFNPTPRQVRYGDPIEFDAKNSTPTGTIQEYVWDFGDGKVESSKKDHVSHAYTFDPSRHKTEQEFQVKLAVRTQTDKVSEPQTQGVVVSYNVEQLTFDLEVYPNKKSFRPGEAVQFKLAPRPAKSPELVRGIVVSFGDGTTTSNGGQTSEPRLECDAGSCKPLVLSHTYGRAGRFEPRLTYTQPSVGQTSPQSAALSTNGKAAPAVLVTSAELSDDELKDKAWEDFYRQFKTVLHAAHVEKKWLALTSMTSANYETEEPDFIPVLDRITRLLVEDPDGYFVLEKCSQVLARLAPEAIVDMRPEFAKVSMEAPATSQPFYRDALEYGLVSGDASNPAWRTEGDRRVSAQLKYGVRIAGIENRVQLLDQSLDASKGQGSLPGDGGAIGMMELSKKNEAASQWLQSLPILMARFKTADFLIAVKILQEPRVEITGPDRYDEELGEALMTRRASVRVHIRLLERTGRVLRAMDITGSHSEMSPQSHESAPPSRR